MADISQRMKQLLDDGLRFYNSPEWEKKWNIIDSLAMAHMFFHDNEKARVLFRQSAEQISHNMGTKNYERELSFMDINGSRVRLAILYDLAGESGRAKEEFEWSAGLYKNFFQYGNKDHIAAYFLWYSYAKLVLGQTEEAYDALLHVGPYFKIYPRNGGELYYVHTQYFLPLLLFLLCEYLLEKTEEKRNLAIYGRDEFIRIIDTYNEDLYGYYQYCQHLAYLFPDAYDPSLLTTSYDPATLSKKARDQRLLRKKVEVRDMCDDEKSDLDEDLLQIINEDRDTIEFFCEFDEMLAYAEMLDQLGDYPATLSLFYFYTLEIAVDPAQVASECNQILYLQGLDERFYDLTKIIWSNASWAEENGWKILLWP